LRQRCPQSGHWSVLGIVLRVVTVALVIVAGFVFLIVFILIPIIGADDIRDSIQLIL
jgi:hypothetical protein